MSTLKQSSPTSGQQGLDPVKRQEAFRASVQFPVTLKDAQGTEVQVTAVNLSSCGIGVQGPGLPSHSEGMLDVSFALPEENVPIQVKARLVWKGSGGRAGIKFIVIEPEVLGKLRQWTNLKMKEEGWELPQ